MNIIATNIPDVLIIEPRIFADHRGFFLKATTKNSFKKKQALKPTLSKITIPAHLKMSLEDSTTKFKNPKPN